MTRINWRRRKREWKKQHAWRTPGRNFTRRNGSNKAFRKMFLLTGFKYIAGSRRFRK